MHPENMPLACWTCHTWCEGVNPGESIHGIDIAAWKEAEQLIAHAYFLLKSELFASPKTEVTYTKQNRMTNRLPLPVQASTTMEHRLYSLFAE
jgi:hypothetical protein